MFISLNEWGVYRSTKSEDPYVPFWIITELHLYQNSECFFSRNFGGFPKFYRRWVLMACLKGSVTVLIEGSKLEPEFFWWFFEGVFYYDDWGGNYLISDFWGFLRHLTPLRDQKWREPMDQNTAALYLFIFIIYILRWWNF